MSSCFRRVCSYLYKQILTKTTSNLKKTKYNCVYFTLSLINQYIFYIAVFVKNVKITG